MPSAIQLVKISPPLTEQTSPNMVLYLPFLNPPLPITPGPAITILKFHVLHRSRKLVNFPKKLDQTLIKPMTRGTRGSIEGNN